ncbi:hypothetical protein D3C73_1238400 [compost metagenome]
MVPLKMNSPTATAINTSNMLTPIIPAASSDSTPRKEPYSARVTRKISSAGPMMHSIPPIPTMNPNFFFDSV